MISHGDLWGVLPWSMAKVRPVVIFKKNSIVRDLPNNLNVGDNYNYKYKTYKQGDKITYNGIDFYVVKNSDGNDSSVTLLKATPLTKEEVKKYGAGHINNYIYNNSISQGEVYDVGGYGGLQYYSSEKCGYINGQFVDEKCISDYDKSEIKHIVDAWSTDKLKTSDLIKDTDVYTARLIKIEELTDYGYNYYPLKFSIRTYKTPEWIYNYQYWTMSKYDENNVWKVTSSIDGNVYVDIVRSNYPATVRPVINLSKAAIDGILEESIDDNNNDNIINKDDTKNNVINQIISVPDTFKSLSIIGTIGICLMFSGILILIFIKNKKSNK